MKNSSLTSMAFGYGTREKGTIAPKTIMNDEPIDPQAAKALIKNELLDEGRSRLNLATFCQTYMENEALELMSDTLDKNAIDKAEYPQTAGLEMRCVNILANLWHIPKVSDFLGTSTCGSSEACMLAGMAMKFRWRNRLSEEDRKNRKPNIVMSEVYQICWEKFCVYWDVEMRLVPIDKEHLCLNTDIVMDYVDENTIGIVGILGTTYTGDYEDIRTLDSLVDRYNREHPEGDLVIHVDAASGGIFTPFVDPSFKWDFKLKHVVSISASGHKYGLTFPGVGWVVWRDRKYLPEELIFEVEYLGEPMPTMAINFSRSASQIVAQYYNFLRFGKSGFTTIHAKTQEIAQMIGESIEEIGLFEMYNAAHGLPIICYTLKENAKYKDGTPVRWTLQDLSDRLLMHGWQVPTYPMPGEMRDVTVQRIVCRADLTYNLGENLIKDLNRCINELKHVRILCDNQ